MLSRAGSVSGDERVFPFVFALPAVCLLALPHPVLAQRRGYDPYRESRAAMVRDFIEREGVTNERVLQSVRSVPRHEFVPLPMRMQAYQDRALAIGYKQTISPPFVVSYMTEALDPQPTDRVLEIGTGSGYQAAVLSGLVRDVYTIEIVEPLGRAAARRLSQLGYANVHAKVGDGYLGWPEHAPFDKIIVTCSPEDVPEPLIEQLRDGGKMIIPLGERYQQVFHLFEKREGRLGVSKLIPTLFVPMTGISEDKREVQPDPENPQIVNGDFETDENDDQQADNWHYQRQTTWMTGDAPEGQRFVRLENSEAGRLAQLLQGMPLDGRVVRGLTVRAVIRVQNVRTSPQPYEQPSLSIHFFDSVRRTVGVVELGPWRRNTDWKPVSAVFRVPPTAREAVVRVGLNGATGQLDVDNIRLLPMKSQR